MIASRQPAIARRALGSPARGQVQVGRPTPAYAPTRGSGEAANVFFLGEKQVARPTFLLGCRKVSLASNAYRPGVATVCVPGTNGG